MTQMNRRQFVGTAATGAAAIALGSIPVQADDETKKVRKATDRVKLGKTGITCSLVGLGTGSIGYNHSSNQTRLGQEKFTELVRHALDKGLTYFDAADQYGSHTYLREALKGVPRDKYVLLSKIINRTADEAKADLDRFRKELGTDYIDIVLLHVVTEPDWNTRFQGVKDVLSEAKRKGIIKAHGCSCHSLVALEAAAADPWVDVDLARYNPWGKHMDRPRNTPEADAPKYVTPVIQKMRDSGKVVLGMKILGQGDMLRGEDRLARARESLRFAFGSGIIHAMTIGFESPRQIDEVLGEAQVALRELEESAAARTA